LRPSIRALVTSAGAAPAAAVLKALRTQSRYDVTVGAVDAAQYAVGYCLADWWEVVPLASDPGFMPRLLEICQRRRVRYVFPIIDEEIPVWARHQQQFARLGITVFVNPLECVDRVRDKRRTAEHCALWGIPQPRLYDAAEATRLPVSAYPLFAKPAAGRGGLWAVRLDGSADLQRHLERHPDALIQELISGEEYTTDVLLRDDGFPLAVVPKRRLEVKSGMATKSITEAQPAVMALVEKVVAAFGVRGVANVQSIVREGQPYLIEVNPKFATSLPLTVAAGINLPLHLIELARGECQAEGRIPFRENLLLLRCWDDYFVAADAVPETAQ
jgi:carbamoyl-phosphate synthase large subunit